MAEYTDDGLPSGIKVKGESVEDRLRYTNNASGLHQRLLSRLKARRMLSERSMSRRYDSWNRVDENCRMFIDLNRGAKNADGTVSTDKKEMPWARSIVVPMSYAILQVFLTQQMGIFTRRDPPIELQGIGPEDVKPAKLMNAVIAYDQVQTNYVLELYTALQDAFKYGMGGFHDCWEDVYGYKTERARGVTEKVLRMLRLPTSQRKWGILKQYNKVEAWDPFQFFPDPRVSLSNIQNSEFCGHRLWRGYLEILAGSQENGGNYFNVEAIPKTSPRGQALRSRNRFNVSQMNLVGSMDEADKGFHAVDSFVVSIIPREWQLGEGERPEKWQFTWVDDQVIIRAHPADYDHGQFNYSAMESNIDTHVFGNPGSIENLDGLQRFMTWFYNSHIQNVIKHLNNRMVFASSFIERMDVENPDAGGHIRLTALGEQMLQEGRMTIPQMIQQLELRDVTTSMLQDIATQMDFAMRMSGAADQMMGRTTSEKRTLGEVQRVGHEGSARQALHGLLMDVQGIRPLALRWASNRQQYTDKEMFVRISGDLVAEFGSDRIQIKPGDLAGNYDYVSKAGPEPRDSEAVGKMLMDGLAMISKNPGLLQIPDKNGKVLDLHEMLKEAYRSSGVKNINDFYQAMGGQQGQQPPAPNVTVMPDEEVAREAERGNIIPMKAA